jgi:hypothetical protein
MNTPRYGFIFDIFQSNLLLNNYEEEIFQHAFSTLYESNEDFRLVNENKYLIIVDGKYKGISDTEILGINEVIISNNSYLIKIEEKRESNHVFISSRRKIVNKISDCGNNISYEENEFYITNYGLRLNKDNKLNIQDDVGIIDFGATFSHTPWNDTNWDMIEQKFRIKSYNSNVNDKKDLKLISDNIIYRFSVMSSGVGTSKVRRLHIFFEKDIYMNIDGINTLVNDLIVPRISSKLQTELKEAKEKIDSYSIFTNRIAKMLLIYTKDDLDKLSKPETELKLIGLDVINKMNVQTFNDFDDYSLMHITECDRNKITQYQFGGDGFGKYIGPYGPQIKYEIITLVPNFYLYGAFEPTISFDDLNKAGRSFGVIEEYGKYRYSRYT